VIDRPRYSAATERICTLFLKYYCSLQVTGTAPNERPFLICANHRSHMDSIAIMAALRLPFAQCGLVAAEDYFFQDVHWLTPITRAMRLIPLSRRPRPHEFQKFIGSCQKFLNEGGAALLAFPQGTRVSSANSFKRGAAVLAIRLGLPVLPIRVVGTEHILPKDRIVPWPGRIHVCIGSLLPSTPPIAATTLREESKMLMRDIEAAIHSLVPSHIAFKLFKERSAQILRS
jgi:1-acyl-sn-glycerol-3-phosphate acyltransferase